MDFAGQLFVTAKYNMIFAANSIVVKWFYDQRPRFSVSVKKVEVKVFQSAYED